MNRYFMGMKNYICLLAAWAVLAIGSATEAAPQPIWLELNQAYLYQAGSSKITRVTVANPAIADVVVLDKVKLGWGTGSQGRR